MKHKIQDVTLIVRCFYVPIVVVPCCCLHFVDFLGVDVLLRITETIQTSVPGFRRKFSNSTRGPRTTHIAARETPVTGPSAPIVQTGQIRQPMGGGLCK